MTGAALFVPHGGGPLPLMGDPAHAALTRFLRDLESTVASSTAIVVVTAHWETDVPTFSGAARPGLLFDYYNYPKETYDYVYPVPGAPALARAAGELMADAGLAYRIDVDRGLDHGTFVPMMLIRPRADIPVLQVSVLASLDPAAHMAMGKALAPLLDEGVTVLGSGLSFHNLRALTGGGGAPDGADVRFDDWLNETVADPVLTAVERERRLADWENAPGARFCHPREEHLLPLHVCYGVAAARGLGARTVFRDRVMGYVASGFLWS